MSSAIVRVTFLVDGFNLYHSLRQAESELGASTKWLDLRSLCTSYLYTFGKTARLERIYYFSALATYRDSSRPGSSARHSSYVECLQSSGIIPELGRFKVKYVYCRTCQQRNQHYEEKETDVAISVRLIELLLKDEADILVLVTGDTDLAPAVRTAQRLYPTKEICFAFPYKRQNSELEKMVRRHFKIHKREYRKHQLPDPFVLPGGRKIRKLPTGSSSIYRVLSPRSTGQTKRTHGKKRAGGTPPPSVSQLTWSD